MSNGLGPELISETELPYLPAALSGEGETTCEFPICMWNSIVQMFVFQCTQYSKMEVECGSLGVEEGPETKCIIQEELLEREYWFWPFEYFAFLKSKPYL